MKILVFVKQVPDTEARIPFKENNTSIEDSGLAFIMNPYDEHAVEEALRTRDKFGGECVVVSHGPERSLDAIRKALAMGADRGVWLNTTKNTAATDPVLLTCALAKIATAEGADLLLCGQRTIDDDSAHLAPMLGEFLGFPHLSPVSQIVWHEGGACLQAVRSMEGGREDTFEINLPAVIGTHRTLNTPRYPTLPNIMKAKKKPITEISYDTLLEEKAPFIKLKQYSYPGERAPGIIIKDNSAEGAQKLVQFLSSETNLG